MPPLRQYWYFVIPLTPNPCPPTSLPMSLWKVAWRSIRQRSLVSALTVVSMGLGVALVVAVLVVYGVVDQSFHRGGEGYDLIVGAKGGKERLGAEHGFLPERADRQRPYQLLRRTAGNGESGGIETVIPVCMGHTSQGFRVVGTIPDMFKLWWCAMGVGGAGLFDMTPT